LPVILHNFEVTGVLRKEHGIRGEAEMIADFELVLPTRRWFFGPFAKALRIDYETYGLLPYAPQRNDCDDFTRHACSFGAKLHNRTVKALGLIDLDETALALGEFWYLRGGDPLDQHAVALAVVREKGKIIPVFMETITQREILLTKEEKISCKAFRLSHKHDHPKNIFGRLAGVDHSLVRELRDAGVY
jgi:hypothetical protein